MARNHIHRGARNAELLASGGINLSDFRYRRYLAQQAHRIEAPFLERDPVPGEGGDPGQLGFDVCYEVADLAAALAELRAKGCLVISKPVPAVAYGGRKIAWCFTPTQQLLELLERDAPSA